MSDLPSVAQILRNSLPNNPRYKDSTTSGHMSLYLRFEFEKWANRVGRCISQGSLRFLFIDVYDRVTFVATDSNKLVGVAEAYPITNDEWLIDSIAVLLNYRRRGIGCQLVKKLISYIQDKGGKKTRLYVQPGNLSAIRFYTELGFSTAPQPIFMRMDLRKGQKARARESVNS